MTSTLSADVEIDWNRVQELYAFTLARAIERILVADFDHGSAGKERHDLHVLETMHAEARRYDDVAACAVLYFRAQAMRAAEHPDFLGAWIIASQLDRRAS
jgi:hypothetical protein